MNNKAHLRPKDYDSNGDIIPMACKEEKGDLISREALKKYLREKSKFLSNREWLKLNLYDIIDSVPTVGLIQSLTELCNEYCKNCPVTDVANECTDCICTHIRGIIKGGAV